MKADEVNRLDNLGPLSDDPNDPNWVGNIEISGLRLTDKGRAMLRVEELKREGKISINDRRLILSAIDPGVDHG